VCRNIWNKKFRHLFVQSYRNRWKASRTCSSASKKTQNDQWSEHVGSLFLSTTFLIFFYYFVCIACEIRERTRPLSFVVVRVLLFPYFEGACFQIYSNLFIYSLRFIFVVVPRQGSKKLRKQWIDKTTLRPSYARRLGAPPRPSGAASASTPPRRRLRRPHLWLRHWHLR
jgi:hypothetical protein